MLRPTRFPFRVQRTAATLAVVLALAAVVASPARAGFGDLVKKAKDKAAQTVVNKATGKTEVSGGGTVEFGGDLVELDGPTLDHVLAGLRAGDDVLASRAGLVARRSQLQNEAGKLQDTHGTAIDAARQKHDTARNCWDELLSDRRRAREEQVQKKMMSDPVLREKMMGMALEVAEAQAQGDTASVAKAQREIEALYAPTRADSLEAKQKCGPVPPPHPMGAKIEALQAQAGAIEQQIRDNDRQSINAQVAASKMEAAPFAMAKERLLLWLAAIRSKNKPNGFSGKELAALDERRAALETALAPWAD